MAVSVTDKPLKLIAELSKKFKTAEKNAGPRLWSEICSGLRLAADAGESEIKCEVPKELVDYIRSRVEQAELTCSFEGKTMAISGWSNWVDPEAKEGEEQP